ncbi:MAG: ATP-binding protein [Candidatus Moranbacteria bacterium]|nr:ATP-binding protein [Candidatus Moranbacteria bacterium]
MLKKRYIQPFVEKDLAKKMVFIGGPRQVGKTTLSKLVGKEAFENFSYFNWDNADDRKKILAMQFDPEATLIVFDEIHKYHKWKNYVKGQYDKYNETFSILVTGSARLDIYRKGGDSLMGRYFYFRLHPFSLGEVLENRAIIEPLKKINFKVQEKSLKIFKELFEFGGFPEPFLSKDKKTLRRWHNQRLERLVREDIRDIENIRDLSAIQILVEMLPERVGSLLSLNSLREDLQVAHGTISLWMDILERFYYHFRLYPFASSTIKSLRKEPKLYLWDWSQVPDEAAKLENIVASHLLKLCHFLYDAHGYKAELNYLRDLDGHEVDFLVTVDKKPWLAVEVKSSDQQISKNLLYFDRKLNIPFKYQVVQTENIDFMQNDVRVMSVDKFLGGLV